MPSGENATDADRTGVPLEGADQLPARRVPQLERLVVAAREQACAVGRERHRGDPPACPSKVRISSPLAASHSLSVLSSLPESRRVPSGEKATDSTRLVCPSQGADQLAAGGVPQLERVVRAAREQARAVGRERNRADAAALPSRRCGSAGRLRRPTA